MTFSPGEPGVAIAVVSYHTMADLRRFIDSYERLLPLAVPTNLKVVLVEATRSEITLAKSWGHPVRSHRMNIGYNVACNDAALTMSGEVLAFFNADCEVTPGLFEGCYEHLAANPDVAVVGPRQVNRAGKLTHAGIGGTLRAPKHRGWMEADHGQYGDVLDCVSVSGSAYFIKRTAFEALATCPLFRRSDPEATGAFASCFHYFGETWLSYHCSAHGMKVQYLGTVPPMLHAWHQASPQGGIGEMNWTPDQAKFRRLCDDHGIAHD